MDVWGGASVWLMNRRSFDFVIAVKFFISCGCADDCRVGGDEVKGRGRRGLIRQEKRDR